MNLQTFKLNRPQLNKVLNPAQLGIDIWGRGTGKSFIIAWIIRLAITQMPRGTFLIYGSTYIDILTNTLPTTLDALARLGFLKNIHYVVGHRPPKKWAWPEPFQPILEPERVIYFCNGTVFHLASQDRTKRGANVDGIICDEGLLIKKDKFEKDILPTNRGNLDRFDHIGIHHFVHIFSSMPFTPEGNWLVEYGQYYDDLGYNYRASKAQLIKAQLAFVDSEDKEERRLLWDKIKDLKKNIKYFTNKLEDGTTLFYQEADAFDNILNIGFKAIKKLRKLMTDISFRIEVLNELVKQLEGGFYPNFDIDVHCYDDAVKYAFVDLLRFDFKKLGERDCRWDDDYNPNKKIEIAVDWGGKINCLVVIQSSPGIENIIKTFFVTPPKILDDVFAEFCHYYRFHNSSDKTIDFWYDRNGNNQQANSKLTFAEQGAAVLRKQGWSVNLKTTGLDAYHNDKYLLINLILSGQRDDLPICQINYTNARELANSILNAPVKDVNGEFKKDKRSEQNANIKQEEATHFSDAFDVYICGKYLHKLDNIPTSIGLLAAG